MDKDTILDGLKMLWIDTKELTIKHQPYSYWIIAFILGAIIF